MNDAQRQALPATLASAMEDADRRDLSLDLVRIATILEMADGSGHIAILLHTLDRDGSEADLRAEIDRLGYALAPEVVITGNRR